MRLLLILSIFLLGVISCIADHPANFTPILSITLLSGFYIKKKYGFLLPISIMLTLYYFLPPTHMLLYGAMLIAYLLIYAAGFYFLKDNIGNVIYMSFLSSIIFFIISNFAVWLSGGYFQNLAGLLLCYEMALPFFKNTLISTIYFSTYFYIIYKFMNSYEKTYNEITT